MWNQSSDKNDDDMTTTVRAAGKAEISKTEVVTKTSLSLLISEKYFQFRKEILLIMIQILSMRNSVHSWSNRNWKVEFSMTAIYKRKFQLKPFLSEAVICQFLNWGIIEFYILIITI